MLNSLTLPAFLLLMQPPVVSPPAAEPRYLPPFELKAPGSGEIVLRRGKDSIARVSGGITLLWGALRIDADELLIDEASLRLEARGNVSIRRGDEGIRGTNAVVDGKQGTLDVTAAQADTPPFFFRGERILRAPGLLVAQNGTIALTPDGRGEVRFRAREIRVVNNETLILRDAAIYLFGTPLLRVRSVAFPVEIGAGGNNRAGRSGPQSPVSLRVSQISGYAVGVGTQITPFPKATMNLLAEYTTRQNFQYSLGLQRNLIPARREDVPRRLASPPGGIGDPEAEGRSLSPLRQLLTARPIPPPPDPVLDYVDILSIPNPLARPTRTRPRFLDLQAVFTSNREFGGRRQGPLLLARQPEITVSAELPLHAPLQSNDNTAAYRGLRSPRFYLFGQGEAGNYRETRLQEPRRVVDRQRASLVGGAGLNPLLLGSRLLIGSDFSYRINQYARGDTYRFSETSISALYVLGVRTGFGVAYIRRATDGNTPFFFDQVDTQNEAQVRGQVRLNRRLTIGLLGRYDTTAGKLFDVEFGVAARGIVLEPRFTYRRLNRQFGFSVGIPGLNIH